MQNIRDFIRDDRNYFENCRQMIRVQNNRMLIDGCVVYALVLAFYTFFSIFTEQPAILRRMYYAYDVIHLIICSAVLFRSPRIKESAAATQVYCAVLELALLSFFALEGAYTSQTEHSLYVPIAILMIPLLFTHKISYTFSIIAGYVAVFAILSAHYKTPPAYTGDIYIAIATFISASIGGVLIARIRHNEGQALNKFEHLSKTDMLTGMNNKSACEELCRRAVEADGDRRALLVIDLDNFKQVNDSSGHAAGDEVIRAVGITIKNYFCTDDITGRFGGDEFIVLMRLPENNFDIKKYLGGLTEKVSVLRFSSAGLSVQCSVGAAIGQSGEDFDSMFRRADRALYAAKAKGKGRVEVDAPTA